MPSKKRQQASEAGVEAVLERVRAARSFDFRNYKRATLQRRIERRMQERATRSIADYLELLDKDPIELDALVSAMLIKVTSFFRDLEVWDELSTRAIPGMLAEKRANEEIRVWSAGCSTGEEAFSLAIQLAEALGPSFANQDVKVFGTDVDEAAIATARRGLYRPEQLEAVPEAIRRKYFVKEQGGYCVRKEVRRNVVFGVNNLVSDAPISRLDLLVCRNVFIYLDAALQKRVLTRFHYALRRNGLLVLGKSELIPFASRVFEPLDPALRIYRKDGRRDAEVSSERIVSLLQGEANATPGERSAREVGSLEQFHRDALRSLRQPIIATSVEGVVMFWNDPAATLWGRSEVDVMGKRLFSLNLPGLSGDLLIEKSAAVREGRAESQRAPGVISPRGGRGVQLEIEIAPLREGGGAVDGLVYLVHDVTPVRELEAELRRANEERIHSQQELQTTNQEMQSSNEELETTNEELQSANEELQTTNEELQSTNEELETTNEELQSTNAELDATNRELAHRTEEMNRIGFLQRNIIRSLSAGIIVIDERGVITMWNLAAERLLGLIEAEAVGQVLWTLHVPALGRAVLQTVRKGLAQGKPVRSIEIEYDLPTGGKGAATVAAIPLADGVAPLGAVVFFEDLTKARAMAREHARQEQDGPAKRR